MSCRRRGLYFPMEHEGIETIPLYAENLALAAPAGHPIANEKRITIERLRDTPSVLLPCSYFLRQMIDGHCHRLCFAPRPVMEMTTLESIIHMVGQGIGVTVLPESYLRHMDNGAIRTVPIDNSPGTTRIGVAYRKNKHLCAASRVFLEQLTAAAENVTVPQARPPSSIPIRNLPSRQPSIGSAYRNDNKFGIVIGSGKPKRPA